MITDMMLLFCLMEISVILKEPIQNFGKLLSIDLLLSMGFQKICLNKWMVLLMKQ